VSKPDRARVRATIAPPAPDPTITASAVTMERLSVDGVMVNGASGRTVPCR
jgi:hypothetical protein